VMLNGVNVKKKLNERHTKTTFDLRSNRGLTGVIDEVSS
jgi:hypothetical protein